MEYQKNSRTRQEAVPAPEAGRLERIPATMSQIISSNPALLTLPAFAALNWIVAPLRGGDVISDEWRGGPFWLEVLEGNLGRGDVSAICLSEYFLGGFPSGRKAEKVLPNIQGPRIKWNEKKYTVKILPQVARPEMGEFHPVPLGQVGLIGYGASSPGELAGGLWVEMKGSFACFPLPEGKGVLHLKGRKVGFTWGHEVPKIHETRAEVGSGYSLPLWRAEKRRMGISLAGERELPTAPKEVRLLLAAAPAECGTDPRKLVAWAEEQKARLVAEKASRATKKGARLTGLSAGPEPLTKGELYRATRWLKRQIRACRIEKKNKERQAKLAARERQALIEAAERLLWSQIDSPSGFGTDKTRAAGQTQVGRVWTGRRPAERVHA